MPPAQPSSLDARARAAVALLAAAARTSPLPDVGGGGWERHANLLVPRGVPTADLPAQLRDLAATPAEHPVPATPARWSRRGRTTAPHAVLLSRIATSRVRFRTFPLKGGTGPRGPGPREGGPGCPRPERGWDLLVGVGADALSPPGLDASPWRVQVAAALVGWLSTWRQDQDRQRASGRSRPFARQLGRRVDLLGRVLAG